MAAGLSCGSSTIKYLLFFFNFLFTICGIVLIAVGAVAMSSVNSMASLDDRLYTVSALIVVVGAIIFIIAFYGCCGAVRESSCMLQTFAVFLMVIIVIEVVGCALAFWYAGAAKDVFDTGVTTLFDNAKKGDEAARSAVDEIQQTFECCGETGPASWGGKIPASCCKGASASDKCEQANAFRDGCKSALKKNIESVGKQLGGVAIGVAIVEVIGVWFALGLAGSIQRAGRTY